MNSLLLLLISAVLAIVFINIIPLGLNRKEKNIVAGSSFLIGTFGMTFSLIAAPWQAVLIMLLLASSVGYIMVSRSAGISPVKGTIRVNENLSRNPFESGKTQETTTQQENMILTPAGEISLNAFPNNQVLDFEEDISFLEERNKIHTDKLPKTDFDDLPVININNNDDFNKENWINEVEKHEMYATSQS